MINKRWDSYWLNVAQTACINSRCLSRHIGAVIVREGKYEVSHGYNGPVSGAPHCDSKDYREKLFELARKDGVEIKPTKDFTCPRRNMGFPSLSGAGYEYCQAAHAERNAIDIAARLGASTAGCAIYMNCGVPCLECAKSIVNAGIVEVVCENSGLSTTKGLSGLDIFQRAGMKIRQFYQEELL